MRLIFVALLVTAGYYVLELFLVFQVSDHYRLVVVENAKELVVHLDLLDVTRRCLRVSLYLPSLE